MKTPEDLLREAEDAEAAARSAGPEQDRTWLLAKAAELRHQADRLAQLARREGAPAQIPRDGPPGQG